MSTEKLTLLEEKAANALEKALENGDWLKSDFARDVFSMGLGAMQRREDLAAAAENDNNEPTRADVTDMDDQGWINDGWAAWRLVLRSGENPSVVFFSRKPTYAERKAFAAAAKVPVSEVIEEARPQ